MYHKIAVVSCGLKTLKDKKVLDLACGRGGGLAFLAKYFEIGESFGVDICKRQIDFAN
jgi:ubiquinone/menaquinone biosynthesis C-methylase UbiE